MNDYSQYVGRPFTGIGGNDCLRLFRDFYREEYGILVKDYARPHDWDSDRLDLIGLCHEREGFRKITEWKPKDIRPGDVMCIAIGERNPNHFAIYVGEGQILHHLYGRMSSIDLLRDFWFNQTCYIIRHPDVPDLTPVAPDVQIMDLLRARNSPSS